MKYAAREYLGLLESHGVALNMTQRGDPYENAVAEQVNGILKDELRPHGNCDFLTPSQVHEQEVPLVRR